MGKKIKLNKKTTKQKNKLGYGELTKIIFSKVADFLIEEGRFGLKPRLPMLLGLLIKAILEEKRQGITEDKIVRTLRNLRRRKLIDIEIKGEKAYVHLVDKGLRRVNEYSLKTLFDFKKKKKKWNKRWYLVFFDVPEIERVKRNHLRRFLRKLGFYQYQQSVYLFPYECEREISLIKDIVEGAKYMKYIIAEKIEDEESAKKHFEIP